MGCANSKDPRNYSANGVVRNKSNHLVRKYYGPKKFTTKEVTLIKQTWNYLAKDMQGNGMQIFLRIFEICPTVKKLFFVDDVRHTAIAKSAPIQSHGARFMHAIGAVVENLGDIEVDGGQVSTLLVLLGQQHKKHEGFKSDYFECFYEALMWQWEYCIGKQFISEVADAWSHLFFYVMEKLLEGYRTRD